MLLWYQLATPLGKRIIGNRKVVWKFILTRKFPSDFSVSKCSFSKWYYTAHVLCIYNDIIFYKFRHSHFWQRLFYVTSILRWTFICWWVGVSRHSSGCPSEQPEQRRPGPILPLFVGVTLRANAEKYLFSLLNSCLFRHFNLVIQKLK